MAFAALLGAASLPGTFALYQLIASNSHRIIELAFWIGLGAIALLALVPRKRISLATNVLDALAVDLFQVVDGPTHRGGADLLENYAFNERPTAPGDGRVTTVIDSRPDAPVGDSDLEHPGGEHRRDRRRRRPVRALRAPEARQRARGVGDRVVSGQAIGLVGDSGNSDEPHLHIQVQNTPTFVIAANDIEAFPILFRDTIVIRGGFAHAPTNADVRRGDRVG